MNKKIVLITLSTLLILGAFLFFKRDNSIEVAPPKNLTIVAFGDSLTEGIGATEGNDFVSLLSEELGVAIINEGKSGDTTENALARIETITVYDPGVVLLLLGGNDFLRGIPEETTFSNLEKIITTLKDTGATVVLLGVRGGLMTDMYKDNFEVLAKTQEVLYVPNVLEGLLGDTQFMADTIHPNNAGYARIAEKVFPVVRTLIGS